MLSGDSRLVKRILSGDPKAGLAFAERFRQDLFNLFAWLTHDLDLAQDLTQDTLLRCWRSLSQYRGEAALRTWVHTIALSLLSTHHRAQARGLRAVAELGSVVAEISASQSAQLELRAALADGLRQLPDAERRAVVLCKLQGLTLREAGAVLGVPVGTVAWQVTSAIRKLRDLLRDPSPARPPSTSMEVAYEVPDRPGPVSSDE